MTVMDLQAPAEIDAEHIDPSEPVVGGAQLAAEARHRHRDGTVVDVEVTSDRVVVDGRECRIALYNDVTERKRLAREAAIAHDLAVEASNMKSAFLANVSHEVRTPMNGVIGMTEMLLQTRLDDEQRTYAEQVEQSSEHMLAIINDILDISKIETGHLALDVSDFELAETIKEASSAAGALARAKGLRRLHQVLANLLSNAVKFTAVGTVTVNVTATATGEQTTLLHMAVSDTGIGIDPERVQRMFEPFTQADVSTTRLYGGTGLGLAIAREIIELMGGTINAESTPGQGSTFWIDVELAAAAQGSDALAVAAQGSDALATPTRDANGMAAAPSWSTAPLVLVAEDSQINQIVATRVLERCGCRVKVVGDGNEALDALAAEHYDAVLMDCQMPGMDGYDATSELRRRERGARHTPVIAMTAHAMTGDRERCIEAGMDDYISKPVRHADLAVALGRWIPAREQEPIDLPPVETAQADVASGPSAGAVLAKA
jgi:hypothetical protein